MMAARRETSPPRLCALLEGSAHVPPELDRRVAGLTLDSRQVGRDGLFFARQGARVDAAALAPEALARGACAMVVAGEGAPYLGGDGLLRVPVEHVTRAAGVAAHRFFGAPTESVSLIAITGTNGKTSVSHFLAEAFERHRARPVGLVGTLGQGVRGDLRESTLTTPDCIAAHAAMASFRDAGAEIAVIEASSHALVQERLAGLRVHTAVFTNLSRDHLDFHGDMERYAAAKARLFEHAGLRQAVINAADPAAAVMRSRLASDVTRCEFAMSPDRGADFTGTLRASDGDGIDLEVEGEGARVRIRSSLLGGAAAWNMLAAFAVLRMHGVPGRDAAELLGRASAVPGRMQPLRRPGAPLVVVDYAHTPAALGAAVEALRALCRGRVWCVFGAGGERDPGKRPLMGEVAAAAADWLVLTDDNPRGEDGDHIIRGILEGIPAARRGAVRVERDRARAIALAIAEAAVADVVLVAGKGHETHQDTAGRRLPFNDVAAARVALAERAP